MDKAFQRIRRLMKFDGGTVRHYKDKIREYNKNLIKPDGRPQHLINDKFCEYWYQKYYFAYEWWKGQFLRSVWRDRATGHIITYGVTEEDIKRVVLPMMKEMEVRRVDKDYKVFPPKTRQTKLRATRPSGLRRV